MREIRQSGSEGGEPQSNAASLPLSFVGCVHWAGFTGPAILVPFCQRANRLPGQNFVDPG